MSFQSCVSYAFVYVCLFIPCGHLLGKGWPLGSSLWCLIVSLPLSHWYTGSGVVLDCIDSWSLHSYLLLKKNMFKLTKWTNIARELFETKTKYFPYFCWKRPIFGSKNAFCLRYFWRRFCLSKDLIDKEHMKINFEGIWVRFKRVFK